MKAFIGGTDLYVSLINMSPQSGGGQFDYACFQSN